MPPSRATLHSSRRLVPVHQLRANPEARLLRSFQDQAAEQRRLLG
jgi:hypothetical protein